MPEFNTPKRNNKAASYQQAPSRSAAKAAGSSKSKAAKQPKPQKPQKVKAARKPAQPAQNTAKRTATTAQSPAKVRRQRRKQNMAIYYMLFLLVSAVVFSVLSATVLFKIEEVVTTGDSMYSYDEILSAANVSPGENLIRFDAAECQARLIENLVYLDGAQIKKKLPNKLVINIDGAVEMANIEYNGDYYIISKNGRILGLADKDSENPIIYGYDADEPVIGGHIKSHSDRKTELVKNLIGTAESAGLTGIVDIDMDDYLNISMNYMNRVELHIGASTDLDQKCRAAAELLDNEIDQNEYGTLRLVDPLKVVFKPNIAETPESVSVALPILPVQAVIQHEQEPENADYSLD